MVKKDKELPPRPDNPIWKDDYCRGCGIEFNPMNPGATKYYHSKECKAIHRDVSTMHVVSMKFEEHVEMFLAIDISRIKYLLKSGKSSWTTREVSNLIKHLSLKSTLKWLKDMEEMNGVIRRNTDGSRTKLRYVWILNMKNREILKILEKMKKS